MPPIPADDDDGFDSDSDSDSESPKTARSAESKTLSRLKRAGGACAYDICKPLERYKIGQVMEYIGWTVEDSVQVGKKRKSRKKKTYIITDVIKSVNDPEPKRIYFQYTEVNK